MAQVPVLPYLTKELGANVAAFGQLQTVFSIIQTVGGLLSGAPVFCCGMSAVLHALHGV